MRYRRQNKIIEIIKKYEVETQEMLAKLLEDSGFKVTQATISRDIKELQLIKSQTADGKYKYFVGDTIENKPINDRFIKIFRETVQSINSSGNIIVLKTLSGCGNAAGEAIDNLNLKNIIGSLAGDNTLFLVIDSPENVPSLIAEFNRIIH